MAYVEFLAEEVRPGTTGLKAGAWENAALTQHLRRSGRSREIAPFQHFLYSTSCCGPLASTRLGFFGVSPFRGRRVECIHGTRIQVLENTS